MRFDRRLNTQSHVVEAEPVDVILTSDQQWADSSTDPAAVFGRLGYPSADVIATMTSSITQSANVPITTTIEEVPSSLFAAGDLVHIGRECFEVSATNDGAKSVTLSARSVLGSPRCDHIVDAATGTKPRITKPPVFFKGRRAIIFESRVNDDGTVSTSEGDWVERWRGFVAAEPEVGTRSAVNSVRLRIAPLTSLLDQPLGNQSNRSFLSQTHHTWGGDDPLLGDGTVASTIEFLEEIPAGAIINSTPGLLLAGDQTGTELHGIIPVEDAGGLAQCMDTGRPVGHPRRVPVSTTARPAEVWTPYGIANPPAGGLGAGWGTTGDGDLIEITAAGYGAAQALLTVTQTDHLSHTTVRNIATSYWRQAKLYDVAGATTQTYRWPERLLQAIAEGWGKAGLSGADNGLISATIHLDSVDASTPCISVIAKHTKGHGPIKAHFVNNSYTPNEYDEVTGSPYKGANWASDTPRRRRARGAGIPMDVINLSESEDDTGITARVVEIHPRSSAQGGAVLVTGLRIAKAWYATGEKHLTLETQPTIPASGRLYMEAVRVSDDGDGETLQTFRVSAISAATVDGETTYRATIYSEGRTPTDPVTGQPLMTMAEHDGEGRIQLRTTAVFDAETSIGEVCLQLMCSSGGNNVTSSAYDKLPIGAGLVTKTAASDQWVGHAGPDIDAHSFLRIASPMRNARYSPQWRDGQTVYEVVSGLLRAAGYVMDIRTDSTGACRLTAVPLGRPTDVEVLADIGETDIASRPSPSSPVETTIFNVFEFASNYEDGEPKLKKRVKDSVSIDTFNEEKLMKIDLPGVQLPFDVDLIGELRHLYSRLRVEFAYPRRLFDLGIRSGLAVQAQVGGTYRITHRQLRGTKSLGVTDGLCRLRSVISDGWKATSRAVFVYYGEGGSGWGPSCDVVAAPNATTITVSNTSFHARPTHPITGADLTDFDGFNALASGDKVRVFPSGDMDNASEMTIQSIEVNNRKIIFTAAHGLADPGGGAVFAHLTATTSSNVPASHKSYAYIGEVLVV